MCEDGRKQLSNSDYQPYWGWTKNFVPPDVVIYDAKVTITDFDGQRIQVENPLVQYRFQGARPFSSSSDECTTTVRYPKADRTENTKELVRYACRASIHINCASLQDPELLSTLDQRQYHWLA